MAREPTITYHDFVNALGEPVYAFKVHCHSNAEREARVARAKAGPVPEAYAPFGGKGEPFDPPEDASRTVPVTYTKWPVSDDYASGAVPPNCDFVSHAHSGQEPTQAGQVLAQAQHEAAEDGEGCGSVACAMTRGVND